MADRLHRFTAIVHISQRFGQDNVLSANTAFAKFGCEPLAGYFYTIRMCQEIDATKPYIVPRLGIALARVTESNEQEAGVEVFGHNSVKPSVDITVPRAKRAQNYRLCWREGDG